METKLLIIADGRVLTCDPHNRCGRMSLLVEDGRIVEVAESADGLWKRYPSASVIDASRKLLVPGFVNAHVHSESLLLREFTDGVPLMQWADSKRIQGIMEKIQQRSEQDPLRSLYTVACAAHIRSGTTTVGEFPPAVDGPVLRMIFETIQRSGLRSVVALRTWEHVEEIRSRPSDGIRVVLDLGLEEDLTIYGLEGHVRAARDLKCPVAVHLGELRESLESVRRNFQKPLLQVIGEYKALSERTMLVHLNHCTEEDAHIARERGCTLTLCVRSALQKQTGYSLLRHLVSEDVRLCLGTDWGGTDLLAEMQLLFQLPLMISGLPQYTPLEILRMATINGAYALGLSGEVGSIQEGKRADLLFFSLQDVKAPPPPEQAKAEELADFLIRRLNAEHLVDVMVGGEFRVVNRHLENADEDDLVARFSAVRERWMGVRTDILPKRTTPALDQPREKPQRPKVIPLIPRERDQIADSDPFDGKLAPPGDQSPTAVRTANLQAPPEKTPVDRSSLSPELPGNVRRVFGDDDEV